MSEPASPSCRNTPDLNPIEQVFAKFKTLLRKAKARSYEAISDACGKILAQYAPAECAAYIKNAGIRVDLKAGRSKRGRDPLVDEKSHAALLVRREIGRPTCGCVLP
jgi:hypothetical protein